MENNGNLKLVLVDLIEEDFTSRAFDNIKSLNSLGKEVLNQFTQSPQSVQQKQSQEDYFVSHLDAFFKYRNKVSELE